MEDHGDCERRRVRRLGPLTLSKGTRDPSSWSDRSDSLTGSTFLNGGSQPVTPPLTTARDDYPQDFPLFVVQSPKCPVVDLSLTCLMSHR